MRARLSIRLAIYLSAIVVAPTLAATALLASRVIAERRDRDRETVAMAARLVERAVKAESTRFARASVHAADSPELRALAEDARSGAGTDDASVARVMLEAGIDWLAVESLDGERLWSSSARDPAWLREVEPVPGEAPRFFATNEGLRFVARETVVDYGDKTPLFRATLSMSVSRSFMDAAKAISGLDATLLERREDGTWRRVATTMTDAYGMSLSGSTDETFGGGEFARGKVTITGSDDSPGAVVPVEGYLASISGRPLSDDDAASYVAALGVVVLALSIAASVAVARGVVRPVRVLMARVGDLSLAARSGRPIEPIDVPEGDEVRSLAGAFHSLAAEVSRALAESASLKDYLSSVIDSSPSPLLALKADMTIAIANDAAKRLLGTGEPEGKRANDLCPSLGRFAPAVAEACLALKPREFYREQPLDERAAIYNVSIWPFRGQEGTEAVLRMDDVTELEKKDAQLRQVQNLDLLGTLAGGLAHDFNNILGGIVGASSLVRMDIAAGKHDAIPEHVGLIEDSSARAKGVIRQLLSLSRKHEFSFEDFDAVDSARRVVKLAKAGFDASVTVKETYETDAAISRGDAVQIEQAILNLLVNGKDAMTVMRPEGEERGGTLEIRVGRATADQSFVEIHPEAKVGDYWMISVSDTGVGMSSKTVAKIFDPFFTTKPKGAGTGLGLAMVMSIARNHGGFVDVYSEPGEGTTMKVFLPVAEGSSVKATEPTEPVPGTGRILLAEDDGALRRVSSEILRAAGYEVDEAGDGRVAARKLREGSYDLVLSDLVMPQAGGLELLEETAKLGAIPFILMSGYRFDQRLSRAKEAGCSGFLEKPFTARKLTLAVSRAIAGEKGVGDGIRD